MGYPAIVAACGEAFAATTLTRPCLVVKFLLRGFLSIWKVEFGAEGALVFISEYYSRVV